jgi:hypothetical protein
MSTSNRWIVGLLVAILLAALSALGHTAGLY